MDWLGFENMKLPTDEILVMLEAFAVVEYAVERAISDAVTEVTGGMRLEAQDGM